MSGIFGLGEDGSDLTRKAPPLQRVVDWFHGRASTSRDEDIHHRLGYGPGDAAPGKDFRAMMLGQSVPGFSGTPWDTGPGFRLLQVVTFTSSGSFKKADYPGLKAIRVRLVGGGGAGGGCTASGSYYSVGQGGGGGGYAERFITDIASLPDTVTVTVGAGGVAVNGTTGGSGGATSFGSLVSASGGSGGWTKGNDQYSPYVRAGAGGVGTAGDILIAGGGGGIGAGSDTLGAAGTGGDSQLGGGAAATASGAGGASLAGVAGGNYGGGGSGAYSSSGGAAKPGGAGAPGIVILELYS